MPKNPYEKFLENPHKDSRNEIPWIILYKIPINNPTEIPHENPRKHSLYKTFKRSNGNKHDAAE